MRSQVRLDGLLFSNDTQVLCVMNPILNNFAIETEVCNELCPALDAVTHRRLDAVVVDWNDASDPTRIVRAARKSSPNSNSTIVALVNAGSETHALLVGANFMIHKPANIDHAGRCMRAAYGTMLQNRRRTARVLIVSSSGRGSASSTSMASCGSTSGRRATLAAQWRDRMPGPRRALRPIHRGMPGRTLRRADADAAAHRRARRGGVAT